MKICFVRHGHNRGDKLTSLGKKQCKNVCYDLYYEDFDKVYCSPLNRTMQTAKIICKKLSISNIKYDERLKEREQLRMVSDDPEIIEYNENYLNYNYCHTNPEGCREFCNRIFSFLDDLIDKHLDNDDNILIIGHSSTLYAINAYFTGIPKDKQIIWMRLGNCGKVCYEINKK